jgi:hypothetical protein
MGEHGDRNATHGRIVGRLRVHADDVRRLTSGLDDALLAKRTVPDKWSLQELVCHLWRVQQVFEGRIEKMLDEDSPAIEPYDPEGDALFEEMRRRPGGECVAGFLSGRERMAGRLEGFTPAEWHRKGSHPEYPDYDVHFQVEYMAHHEAHHMYQMFTRRQPLGKVPHS